MQTKEHVLLKNIYTLLPGSAMNKNFKLYIVGWAWPHVHMVKGPKHFSQLPFILPQDPN